MVDHKSWCHTACVASDQCSTVGHQCCLIIVVATVVTKWMQQRLFDWNPNNVFKPRAAPSRSIHLVRNPNRKLLLCRKVVFWQAILFTSNCQLALVTHQITVVLWQTLSAQNSMTSLMKTWLSHLLCHTTVCFVPSLSPIHCSSAGVDQHYIDHLMCCLRSIRMFPPRPWCYETISMPAQRGRAQLQSSFWAEKVETGWNSEPK